MSPQAPLLWQRQSVESPHLVEDPWRGQSHFFPLEKDQAKLPAETPPYPMGTSAGHLSARPAHNPAPLFRTWGIDHFLGHKGKITTSTKPKGIPSSI